MGYSFTKEDLLSYEKEKKNEAKVLSDELLNVSGGKGKTFAAATLALTLGGLLASLSVSPVGASSNEVSDKGYQSAFSREYDNRSSRRTYNRGYNPISDFKEDTQDDSLSSSDSSLRLEDSSDDIANLDDLASFDMEDSGAAEPLVPLTRQGLFGRKSGISSASSSSSRRLAQTNLRDSHLRESVVIEETTSSSATPTHDSSESGSANSSDSSSSSSSSSSSITTLATKTPATPRAPAAPIAQSAAAVLPRVVVPRGRNILRATQATSAAEKSDLFASIRKGKKLRTREEADRNVERVQAKDAAKKKEEKKEEKKDVADLLLRSVRYTPSDAAGSLNRSSSSSSEWDDESIGSQSLELTVHERPHITPPTANKRDSKEPTKKPQTSPKSDKRKDDQAAVNANTSNINDMMKTNLRFTKLQRANRGSTSSEISKASDGSDASWF